MPILLTTDAASFELKPYKSLSNEELHTRIAAIRAEMGPRLLILGHHYQQDEVIALSDLQGDSYQLSQLAADSTDCRAIVFCGVHFMAETADVLANRPERLEQRARERMATGSEPMAGEPGKQVSREAPVPILSHSQRAGERVTVVLPDLAAGCSMADMAAIEQVENCWDALGEVMDTGEVTPVTYINSAASLKAFCGRHGGIVCTSSNAAAVLRWAFERTRRVLFFPDQHLGRNTARAMGIPLEEISVWNPHAGETAAGELGGNTAEQLVASRVLLWQGHCSVHAMFRPEHVDQFRARYPGIKVLVHPECSMEVVDKADLRGSTSRIIREVDAAPPGTRWAIGTELHLVNRLKHAHPEQEIHFLSPVVCMCATMYRIDLAHLCWSLENLAAGTSVNVIRVDDETARWALIALERMLTVK